MKNIAIFASHNGSGFDAILEAIKAKELNLNIALVVSNNTDAPVLTKAKANAIAHYLVNAKTGSNTTTTLHELLLQHNCKYIFLSGYMKKLDAQITQNFSVLNSHPSLLPSYGGNGMYGHRVHEAVIRNKEPMSGVSIHEVNEEYDSGKIILQKSLSLQKDETATSLETKIKALEKVAIVEALREYLCIS